MCQKDELESRIASSLTNLINDAKDEQKNQREFYLKIINEFGPEKIANEIKNAWLETEDSRIQINILKERLSLKE